MAELIFMSIMMLTRLTMRSTITLVAVTPIVAILGWSYLLKDYQKERVISFWNLFVDTEADKLMSKVFDEIDAKEKMQQAANPQGALFDPGKGEKKGKE